MTRTTNFSTPWTTAAVVAGFMAVLVMVPLHAEWEQVITFNDFELGTFKEPDAAIAQVVRVVRDEGFEVEATDGFARHHLAEDGTGGLMYSLSTDGYGWSWGHIFAAIPLDRAIEERGTLYFQFAIEGSGSHLLSIGLSPEAPDPVDPSQAANPWGWSGMGNWSGFATQFINYNGRMALRDGAKIWHRQHEWHDRLDYLWVPGVWYEIWKVVNVAERTYSVHIRAPDAGIPVQTQLIVDDGFVFGDFGFRHPSAQPVPESIGSIYFGMIAGDPEDPNVGHRWWITNVAVDFEEENLGDPPVPAPGPPPPVDPRIFGFPPVTDEEPDAMRVDASGFLGRHVWFGDAPYAYIFALDRWLFLPNAADRDSHRTNLAALHGTWAYIWDSPFAEEGWHFASAMGTWVYGYQGGWTFVLNSRDL